MKSAEISTSVFASATSSVLVFDSAAFSLLPFCGFCLCDVARNVTRDEGLQLLLEETAARKCASG
jgi:hypothetical protein